MADLFKIKVVFSTSHWIMPKIIICVLIVLGAIIIITEGLARKKRNEPFFGHKVKIFIDNYDKVKFWGSLILFILFILSMDIIGFLPASLIFVFLFNVLFCATKERKSIITSAAISIVTSVAIWYIFGVIFNVTLPTAIF